MTDYKDAAKRTWGASPAGTAFADGTQPGTREFFNRVSTRRSEYEQPWLKELIPFARSRGRDVLELGCGAGYDAYTFVANGARYTGIDIAPENAERTTRHLALFGYRADIIVGDAEDLPFAPDSFDIVYSNGVLHHTPDIQRAFAEAWRVLRPGGTFYVIVYNRNSVFYLLYVVLWDHLFHRGYRQRSLASRRSMIEYTTSDARPLVNVYTRTDVRRLLARAGFAPQFLKVRKLAAEDFPQARGFRRLWRHIPDSVLAVLATRWGWYVIACGRKPGS